MSCGVGVWVGVWEGLNFPHPILSILSTSHTICAACRAEGFFLTASTTLLQGAAKPVGVVLSGAARPAGTVLHGTAVGVTTAVSKG